MRTNRDHAETAPRLGRYEVDAGHSTVTFRTRHLYGLAPVRGTFAIRTGTIDITEPLADSGVHVEIETASFHTGNRQRDAQVRSARFLDAGRYPVMTFVSGRLDGSTLTGTLTVRDVARPVSLSIESSVVAPRSFTLRATTRIDRTEFGVTASRGLTGRYLDVSLEVRCVSDVGGLTHA
ncbi:YceI family protein [Actinomadura alba]|uniref:YceI family protein n=1 Tax=Actinomadura alba TaxID=406431 RepID=A0ABR7LZM7_9ACTN|nr:YceI family protein [Actinomadura alba]MBC6470216.1 YceI family protein [Actinomadura alba]